MKSGGEVLYGHISKLDLLHQSMRVLQWRNAVLLSQKEQNWVINGHLSLLPQDRMNVVQSPHELKGQARLKHSIFIELLQELLSVSNIVHNHSTVD